MRQKNEGKAITAVVLLFLFIHLTYADTVQLDLFSVGCPSLFDPNHSWSSDIDLGVQFSQIDSVYIDWAGQITAGLAIDYDDPCNTFPLDVGITAGFLDPIYAHADQWGGEATYPNPEPFNIQSNFTVFSFGSWESLLDGKGPLALSYSEKVFGTWGGAYIEPGSISLTNATLVVEGTVIPEPATLLLTAIGGIFLRRRS